MKPRVLFLSHSASRNGASLELLYFLRWLKANVDCDIDILVNGRGPLVDEFRAIGRTRVCRNATSVPRFLPPRLWAALRPHLERWCVRWPLAGRRFDLVYANTAATWQLLGHLLDVAPARLWHIHELEYALNVLVPESAADLFRSAATQFVAASESVRKALLLRFGLPAGSVDVVSGFVPFPRLSTDEMQTRRGRVMSGLGWPERTFVIGGCGSLGWRKGTDLFLQIAQIVSTTPGYDDVRFLWVGGSQGDRAALEFQHDLHSLGLEARCLRVAATDDVLDYYCAMDAFALTSREDPCPLVLLEAAAQRLPIVCFAESGGGPEFVGIEAGLVAPYMNVAAFAAHLMNLHDDPVQRARFATIASDKARTRYSLESQAPRVLEVIERCLAARAASAGGVLAPDLSGVTSTK